MKISEDQIKVMIDAAIQAPTWKNSQTGRYYVAISEDKINYLKNQCLPTFNAASCENAVALIVTAYETKRGVYDLGLQNENLILKARETGYDTLIMGIRDADKIREGFDIPESQEIVAVIAVGVRENDAEKPKRKTPDDITRFF